MLSHSTVKSCQMPSSTERGRLACLGCPLQRGESWPSRPSVRLSVCSATGAAGSRPAPGHPPASPALGVPPNACVASGFPSKGRIWAFASVGLLRGNTGRGERALGRVLGWQQQDQLVKSTCILLLLLLQPHFPLAQELHMRNELFQG